MEYKVTSLNDFGFGSFRYGLKHASHITFEVTGTITLTKDLPKVNHQIAIDSNKNITIDCNGFGGLVFSGEANSSIIRFLILINAKKDGITISTNNIRIEFCKFYNNTHNGIALLNSQEHIIHHNYLCGNGWNGLFLYNTDKCDIKNNYLGVDDNGETANPNLKSGLYMKNSNGNVIGGREYGTNDPTGSKGTADPTFVVPFECNLISGNKEYGILMKECKNNILFGNFIGTNSSGGYAIGNGLDGVFLNKCERISFIGCSSVQNPFVYYNVMSGNGQNGLHITDCNQITIHGNFFGIGANNATILPNNENGILIDGSSNRIQIGYYIPLGNVCSGNRKNGIYITENATNVISYNTFGGLAAFSSAIPNGQNAIKVDSTNEGGIVVIRTCVLSGNRGNGIALENTKNVIIDSVICGLSTQGIGFLPNIRNNLLISNSHDVSVITHAKSVIFSSNVFGGSHGFGIFLTLNSYNVKIESCFIGVDILGKTSFSNRKTGINIDGFCHDNTINSKVNLEENTKLLKQVDDLSIQSSGYYLRESNTPLDQISEAIDSLPNIISGNDLYGIFLDANTYNNFVFNNYIGYNIDKKPLANYVAEVVNKSDRNFVKNNYTYHHSDLIEN